MRRTTHVDQYLSSQHLPKACSSVPVFCYARLQHPTRDEELSFVTWGISRFGGLPLSSPGKTVTSREGKFFSSVYSTPPHPLGKREPAMGGSQYVSLFDAKFQIHLKTWASSLFHCTAVFTFPEIQEQSFLHIDQCTQHKILIVNLVPAPFNPVDNSQPLHSRHRRLVPTSSF